MNGSTYTSNLANMLSMIYPWQDRYQSDFSFFQRVVTRFKIRSALDAGCGDGLHLCIWKELKQIQHIVGVDNSPAMIQKAKRNTHQGKFNIEIKRANLAHLTDVISGTFDMIACSFTLSTLDNEDTIMKVLLHFKTLLSKNGVLLVEDTNGDRLVDRTPPPELLSLSSNWYWLLQRSRLKIRVYNTLPVPIQVKKQRGWWDVRIRSRFLYQWVQPNNFCFRTYQLNGPHVYTNYLTFQSGLIRRLDISLHRTVCWLLTNLTLQSYLKKAGFRVISTYSDHEFHRFDNTTFSQIMLAKKI